MVGWVGYGERRRGRGRARSKKEWRSVISKVALVLYWHWQIGVLVLRYYGITIRDIHLPSRFLGVKEYNTTITMSQ